MQDSSKLTQSNLIRKQEIHQNFKPQTVIITNSMLKELFENSIFECKGKGEHVYIFSSRLNQFFGGVKHTIYFVFDVFYKNDKIKFLDFDIDAVITDQDSPFYNRQVECKSIANMRTINYGAKIAYDKLNKTNVEQ